MADNPIPEDIREVMQGIGRTLDDIINEQADRPMCFMLMVFDIGEGGTTSYISNGQREGIVKAMQEFIEKQDDGESG